MGPDNLATYSFKYPDIIVKHNAAKKYLYLLFPEPGKANPFTGPGEVTVPDEPLLLVNLRYVFDDSIVGETLMGSEFLVTLGNKIDDENNEFTYLIVYSGGGARPVAGGKFSFLDFQKGEAEIPEPLDQYLDNSWDHLYKDMSGGGNTQS